jgi:predicted  nucleic acid-binding Zn-ribbon protein
VLRELHRIHQQLSDLRERLDRGPQLVRARTVNVTRLEEELTKAQADSKAAHVAAEKKQLLLKSGELKIEDLQRKLNAANSNREYQALKDQIAADQMANSVLADEILESLEKVDEFQGKIATAQQNLAKGKSELDKAQQQVREQQESLQADASRLEGELKTVEKQLHAEFRDAYDRAVKSKGSDAMAQLEGETCSGCFHTITPNLANAVRMDRVVFCQTCGRLLYLPEDRSIGR